MPMMTIEAFKQTIYNYYAEHKREFAWRRDITPYRVLVSEIMLQQTQTDRVIDKFDLWMREFPDFSTLAHADQGQVLRAWSGLGYNRRALALYKIAQTVVRDYGGNLPEDPEVLQTFSGIGPNTAGSIGAFAFNRPTVFIETNIRAVFIHFFFHGQDLVHDKELMPLITQSLDFDNPREWYYALMDYGVMLKKKHKNPARKSAHHAVQSKFEGSERQIRGMILKALGQFPHLSYEELCFLIPREENRVIRNLEQLCKEGLVREIDGSYFL